MVNRKKNEIISLVLLLIVGIIVYHRWLNISAFAFGDWGFGFREVYSEIIFPYTGGVFGPNILLWKYPFFLINGLVSLLGFNSNVIEKVIVFWPIILLTPISGFLIVKKITRSNTAGVIGSLIFSYNTYFLSISTQGHLLLPLAYAWGAFACITFINLLENKKLIWLPITALLLFVVGATDLRSLYVISMILCLYALYHQLFIERKIKENFFKNILRCFSVFFILFLLNIFWILPAITIQNLTSGAVFYSELFGGEFYNIQNAISFFYPFWTGKETAWLQLQEIPLSFWLFPLVAFSGLLVGRRNKKIVFFGLIALFGIFLSKQESQPFPQVYPWLFQHIPGFAAFREASKFNFLIVLGYAVLFASFSLFIKNYFKEKKYLASIIIFFLALLPLWNTIPFITGEIKSLYIPKTVPEDFIKLSNYFKKENNFQRVFAINNNIYWLYSTSNHPVTDAVGSVRNYWAETKMYDVESDMTEGKRITLFLTSDSGRRLLSNASVGHLVVNIKDVETNSNVRRDFGENREFFEKSFDKVNFLEKKDIGLKNTLLYENKQVRPLIYLTQEKESLKKDIPFERVQFTTINPTEHRISIMNLRNPMYLNFAGLYHPDWKLRVGSFHWKDAVGNKSYFIESKFHQKNEVLQNTFLLDPEYLKKNDDADITVNEDGSINMIFTLFFRPQAYLYLGLLISTTVFVLSLFSIVILFKWKK